MINKAPTTAREVSEGDPALTILTARERTILQRRRTETLQAIATTEEVSRVRIRQIEQRALWKLRGPRASKARREARGR